MFWKKQEQTYSLSISDEPRKTLIKQNSTMLNSQLNIDEENEFKGLLIPKIDLFEDKSNCISHNNSFFNLKFEPHSEIHSPK